MGASLLAWEGEVVSAAAGSLVLSDVGAPGGQGRGPRGFRLLHIISPGFASTIVLDGNT